MNKWLSDNELRLRQIGKLQGFETDMQHSERILRKYLLEDEDED